MPSIDLHFVDELIAVRHVQHGGGRGAPELIGRHRVGAPLNRSCIVMLSALLQGYVEDVFLDCSRCLFPKLTSVSAIKLYRGGFRQWGNPSSDNIDRLFIRIGIVRVLDRLSWRNCKTPRLRERLNEINEIRNDIAHGKAHLKLNGQPFSLRLERVERYRNFVENFGQRFGQHALDKTR